MIGGLYAPSHSPVKSIIEGVVEPNAFQNEAFEIEHPLFAEFGRTWTRLLADQLRKL